MVLAYASQNNLSQHQALFLLMKRISTMIAGGDIEFLGPEFKEAANQARAENFGVLDNAPKIELDKLHRSAKTKSGYVGVYANGKGFRAMGRESKANPTQVYLGQYETAEAAAWHRYLHYKGQGMPYGMLEEEIERYRRDFKDTRPEEAIIADIRTEAAALGEYALIFPGEPLPLDSGKYLKPPPTAR